MRDQIEISYDFSRGINRYLMVNAEGTQSMTHDEEVCFQVLPCNHITAPNLCFQDVLMESSLQKLFNVDGKSGRDILPFPHNASYNTEVLKYDKMTVAQRLFEIRDSLTPNERAAIEAFVLLCSGGTLETTSFFELLHWWALSAYSYQGCIEYLVKYKFRFGQSSFSIRFFREAQETGNLSYVFECPVASVRSRENIVQVTARDGRTFQAARMISAIPLNVLNAVQFDPPLSQGRRAAVDIGHINQCIKVHAEVRDRHLRSWTGITYPHNKLIYGFGDGTTPAGNTHIVCFGAQYNHFEPQDDIQETIKALREFVEMDIERIVSKPSCKVYYAHH
jgi:hypothetical protein